MIPQVYRKLIDDIINQNPHLSALIRRQGKKPVGHLALITGPLKDNPILEKAAMRIFNILLIKG